MKPTLSGMLSLDSESELQEKVNVAMAPYSFINKGDICIYIAGDTEDIPELNQVKDIDIAFLPVNQPYTMTP